jgi:hypothetical protein
VNAPAVPAGGPLAVAVATAVAPRACVLLGLVTAAGESVASVALAPGEARAVAAALADHAAQLEPWRIGGRDLALEDELAIRRQRLQALNAEAN